MNQKPSQTPQQRLEKRNNHSYSNAAGLNPSHAAQNKWICYLPFKIVLGDAYPNLELQVRQFYLPQIEVPPSTIHHRGYSIRVPAAGLINAGDKEIKFQYIVDDDWRNYTSLYTWASKFADIDPPVDGSSETVQLAKFAKFFATIRLWLLNPYKERIVDFVFRDCWIFNFGDILLDCTSSDPIIHSFSLSYSRFEIEDNKNFKGNQASNNKDFI